jgi:hypothetical protein
MVWSNIARQRAASMLWPAATARPSGVHTTLDDHEVAVSVPAPVPRWRQAWPHPWTQNRAQWCTTAAAAAR